MILVAEAISTGQNDRMAKEDALIPLGEYLHQDIDLGAENEVGLARNVLAFLSAAELKALWDYLSSALDELAPSELKGRLNRVTPDWGFSSKGADAFLRAIFAQLEGMN
jgi:hypothetical protein